MKKTLLLFAAALTFMLSACQMIDEVFSNGSDPNKIEGTLKLNILANEPSSMTRANVSTDNFEITIKGKDNLSDSVYNYTGSTLPSSITLVTGKYEVNAHTPGTLERKMSAAYYLGTQDVTISKDLTTNKEIPCTMANSRFSMNYSEQFLNLFKSWTITIDDGSDQVLEYTQTDTSPKDVFWYFINEPNNITVNIRATTNSGNTVESQAVYNKRNCEESYSNLPNENFTGGDAITINMIPVEDGATGSITGIKINAVVTFDDDNYEETVSLKLKDKKEENGDVPITISEPEGNSYLIDGVFYTQDYDEAEDDENGMHVYHNYPTNVALHFEIPNGLKNLYVLVDGTDEFNFMTGLMGLTAEPYGLDLSDTKDENRETIASMNLFTMPDVGSTTYDFVFSEGIWQLLPSFVGKQNFKLRAVDTKGNYLEKTLTVTIYEKQ